MMRLCPHPVGRTIGVSHRVGALVVPRRLRPLYCPWPRFFARFPGEFSAACTSPCCALRGISGGATMPYRSPGRFRFPHPTRPGFFLCTLDYEPAKPVHKKHNTHQSTNGPLPCTMEAITRSGTDIPSSRPTGPFFTQRRGREILRTSP